MEIQLKEYESCDRELDAAQVRALTALDMVSVEPTWTRGLSRVRAGAIVGAVRVADDLDVRVNPKLPVRRVVYLLCHGLGLATWDEEVLDLDDDAPLDVALAQAFAGAATQAVGRGARSDYYRVDADLPELRGKLDTNEQRRRFGLPLPVSVTYDEYGVDIVENQLLLGASEVLRRLPTLPTRLRCQLRRVAAALHGAKPATRHDARAPVRFTRLNKHYRPAVALARSTLLGHGFELGRSRAAVGFTINMFKVFERFLEVALSAALERLHGGKVHPQRHDHLDDDRAISLKPDLTWVVHHRPIAVIDAKYKTLSDLGDQGDLYQALAYATALGTPAAYLVHATSQPGLRPARVRNTGIAVHSTGLDLSVPLIGLRAQLEQLAHEIGMWTLDPMRTRPGVSLPAD